MDVQKRISNYASGLKLDVGFASKPNKWLDNVIGIDLKETICPKNYIKIFKGELDYTSTDFLKNYLFDTIIFGELLDHFSTPSNGLHYAKKYLEDHGILIISVLNPYNPLVALSNIFNLGWYYAPQHICAFTPMIMKALMKEADFKLIKVDGIFKRNIIFVGEKIK